MIKTSNEYKMLNIIVNEIPNIDNKKAIFN